MDSRDQFEMLSTVSNYHPLGFPSTQDPQKIKTPNISFHEHIATPEKQRYIPTSPRNRIMYFIKSGELRHLKNYLKFLQLKDNIPEFQTDEPPHKKQRLTGRARRVDAFRLKQKYLSPELVDMIRQSNIDRSLYTKFKNQLLTSGTIKWRYNQDGRNVCIMNDYSVNGHLMPNSFAHISSEFTDPDTPVIRCSCQIYNYCFAWWVLVYSTVVLSYSWAFLRIPYYRRCRGTQRCLLFPIKIQRGYATRAVL